jgi:threonine/homoserine/homoserine lactone efflux protein
MEPLGGGVWGGVVAPLGSAYVGFLVMLVVYRRSAMPGRGPAGRPPAWPALLRHLVATAIAGYVIFLAIVVVFSFVFADQGQAIRQALTGGAFLGLVGLVGLAALGWVEGRVRRPPRSSSGPGDPQS